MEPFAPPDLVLDDRLSPADSVARCSRIRHLLVEGSPSVAIDRSSAVRALARQLAIWQAAEGKDVRLMYLRPLGQMRMVESCEVPTDFLPWSAIGDVEGPGWRYILTALTLRADRRTLFHLHGIPDPLLTFLCDELRRRAMTYALSVHGRYDHLLSTDRPSSSNSRTRAIERRLLEDAVFVLARESREIDFIRRIAPRVRVGISEDA